MAFGGLRLAFFRPTGPTVQVAVFTTNVDGEPLPDAKTPGWQRLVSGSLTAEERGQIVGKMAVINDDLLTTLYALRGDYFPWLCGAGLLALVIVAIARAPRRVKATTST